MKILVLANLYPPHHAGTYDLRCQMAETAQAEVRARYNETTVVDQIENYLNTSIEVWQHT